MSTVTQAVAQDPDRDLAVSFVAMASGVSSNVETTETTVPSPRNGSMNSQSQTETVRALVGETPINEFTHLPLILSHAFPIEFPFGVTERDLGSTGTVRKRILRRLTRVYDGRIAHNYMLLMYLANLVYRHIALKTTCARVELDSSKSLVEIINHPEWNDRAAAVSNNPTGPEAKALIKQISSFVRLTGKKVPWSPMERLSASYHIYALYHHFSLPAFFVTFAPKTLTNQLMFTFGLMQSQYKHTTVNLKLPRHLQRRVRLLTSNTIAQARAYELMLKAVLTVLFGIKPDSSSLKTHMPKPGLFGTPTAYYGVTECQSRNALHAHLVVWVRTLHPEMLQRIAHDDELRKILVNAVDSVVTASTEHFESCVPQADIVCKFKSKPYGLRYKPTTTHKSVKIQSVVWGSSAANYGLTPNMRMIWFGETNVTNMGSDQVREMVNQQRGPITIVFRRDPMFDPASGRLVHRKGEVNVHHDKVCLLKVIVECVNRLIVSRCVYTVRNVKVEPVREERSGTLLGNRHGRKDIHSSLGNKFTSRNRCSWKY